MAIPIKECKAGTSYIEDGELFLCLFNQQNKQGRLSGKYLVKRKNMRTGSITEVSYNPTAKVDQAFVDKKEYTYSYTDGVSFVFMDPETYETIEIPAERLEYEKNFLVDGSELLVNIRIFNGEILDIILPDKVELEVAECEGAVKGDTQKAANKNAILETGLEIKVPLFINQGERIVVSTIDGTYASRAK
ncbi:MAG: elongation factor P [Bacillota bacterium]|nr:elongation factor P [Bacillota bacterium]